MKRLLIALLSIPFAVSVVAEEGVAISDDGREVELGADGSWRYVSEDRFATLPDGRRIRLKADGTWETVNQEDAEKYGFTQKAGFSRDSATLDSGLTVEITDYIIEKKRSARHKNARVESIMLISLKFAGAPSGAIENVDVGVTDSRGRSYRVTQVDLQSRGGEGSAVLVAEGAPAWWGNKFFRVEFAAGVFGPDPVALTRIMNEVTTREVDSFSLP